MTAEVSAAFDTLAKVKRKNHQLSSTIFKGRSAQLVKPAPEDAQDSLQSHNKTNSGGWLTWGTSTTRSSIFNTSTDDLTSTENPEEDTSIYLETETFHSPRASIATIEKIWRPLPRDEVDQCVDRMLAFAGIDEQTQPIVENEEGYTLILFASSADLIDSRRGVKTVWPGWTWCWKAWRTLGRSYRKNLKKLDIVHPTRFTTTLEGKTFSQAHDRRRNRLPYLITDCIKALRDESNETSIMDKEGIFRVSPSVALVRAAKYAYTLKDRPSLDAFIRLDAHLPAALLKEYLRCMPTPIFAASMYPIVEKCPAWSEEEAIQYIREHLIPLLREERILLLSYTLQCMHDVSQRSDKNRMDASNLATVLTPNLIRSKDTMKDISMCKVQYPLISQDVAKGPTSESVTESRTTLGTVMAVCIDRYYEIFDELDVGMPILSFDSTSGRRRDSIGTLSTIGRSNKKHSLLLHRNVPSSPSSRHTGPAGDAFAPPSPTHPTHPTLKTKMSSSSLRIKPRVVSGGSLRGGVGLNIMEKSNDLVALMDTSACGEFDRGALSLLQRQDGHRRASLDWAEGEGGENEDVFIDALPGSPTLQQRRNSIKDNKSASLMVTRHDRRPLSEVFEE
ncbi:hypothetical protein MRB53_040657 [Persea americana]|nr:hypothetical protein MRB53_040657 [Persea americana]